MKNLNYLNDKRLISNLNYLNDKRLISKLYPEEMQNEHNGAFELQINGGKYHVIASDGMGWEHVSVSHRHKVPTWEVMCKIKELFFEDTETVMQLHPPKADYINNHPYCLHLWRPTDGTEIPRPPQIMV